MPNKVKDYEIKLERKQELLDDPTVIKNLFTRIIERALMDCTGSGVAVNKSNARRLANDSLRFFKSEWGQDMCEFCGLDNRMLLIAAKKYIEEVKLGTYQRRGGRW